MNKKHTVMKNYCTLKRRDVFIFHFCLSFSLTFFLSLIFTYSLWGRGLLLGLITLSDIHTRQDASGRGIGPSQTPSDNTHIYKTQTSMPPAVFEHTIPARKRPQTYVQDRAATGIGMLHFYDSNYSLLSRAIPACLWPYEGGTAA